MSLKKRPYSSGVDLSKFNSIGSVCPLIVRHEFPNQNQKIKNLLSLGSRSTLARTDKRPLTAFSSKTMASNKSIGKKTIGRNNGPLMSHMKPRNFDKMKILQNNSSKYFRPRVKLRTETLHKVLYKLKKEKQDLDQSLERLEMISNFGETKLQIDYIHTNIIRDLNIKANPKNAMPNRHKRRRFRKNKSSLRRPKTAMSRFVNNTQSVQQIRQQNKQQQPQVTSKERMEKFYNKMNSRYRAHKMTRRHSSYLQGNKNKTRMSAPLDDEIRKNSHHHYWVPEDIMFIKGTPLKKALKHLEIHNIRKMNRIKKNQYKVFSGGSKPSILPIKSQKNPHLEITGRGIEITTTERTEPEEFEAKFNNYLNQIQVKEKSESKVVNEPNNAYLTNKQKEFLTKYQSRNNFEEIIEDDGSDDSYDLDQIPDLKATHHKRTFGKESAKTKSTRPHTAVNRMRPMSSHPAIMQN